MSCVVQVVGGRVISGVGKSGKPYSFCALAVVAQDDRGVVVGELVLDGEAMPAPGRYAVELVPRVRDGRMSFAASKLTPVPPK